MKKRCCIIARVSTENQQLESQIEKLIGEARRLGYSEENTTIISGKESGVKLDIEERQTIQKLRELIATGEYDMVIIWEVSRLARRPKVLYEVREWLIENRVNLRCMTPSFTMLRDDFTIDPTASIVFSLFSTLAEEEARLSKERMRRGASHAKAMGKHIGGYITFGYSTDSSNKYTIDEREAKIVRWLFEEYVKQEKSTKELTIELREKGIFSDITLHGAINDVYCILKRDEYAGTNEHKPQIISRELFERAQEIMKAKAPKIYMTENLSLLKGLLYDASTNHVINSNMCRGAYYSKQGGISVRMSIIDPIAWDVAVKLHKKMKKANVKQMEIKLKKRMGEIFLIRSDQVKKKQDLQDKIDKIEERLIMGKISDAKAEEMESSLLDEMKMIDRRAAELNDELAQANRRILDMKEGGEGEIEYSKLNDRQRFNIVHQVIEKIILSRDDDKKLHIEIHNKYNDAVENVVLVRKWRNWVIEK